MKSIKPYWLDGGSEVCHGCTHRYVYEVEIRCTGCDRGLCTHCVVIESVTHAPFCAECIDEQED